MFAVSEQLDWSDHPSGSQLVILYPPSIVRQSKQVGLTGYEWNRLPRIGRMD